MASFRRGKKGFQKHQGKGTLEKIHTEGPYIEWVGMPEYYLHHLLIEGKQYSYQDPEKVLDVEIGEQVVFRYFDSANGLKIDRKSLGRWIDPTSIES